MSGETRAVLEAIFEGLAAGDGRPFVDAMAEDFTWIMPGSTDWSDVTRARRRCAPTCSVP